MKTYVVTGIVYLACMWMLMAALTGCKSHAGTHAKFDGLGGGADTTGQGGAGGSADKLSGAMNDNDLTDEYPPCEPLNRNKIYFDYNSAGLTSAATTVLGKDADYMKKNPGMYRIEGHCDERGTQEFNLALGEKRAQAVRDYLVKLGVPGDSLFTMSYGKEKPERDGHTEADWKFNRRCEFSVRAR